MATGANTTPLGRLHPVLAAKLVPSDGSSGGGSKDPELKRHLEAAKRAAEALFSGVCIYSFISDVCLCVCNGCDVK